MGEGATAGRGAATLHSFLLRKDLGAGAMSHACVGMWRLSRVFNMPTQAWDMAPTFSATETH